MNPSYILIADSGSTKTDWALTDPATGRTEYFGTPGINPSLLSRSGILERLHGSPQLTAVAREVNRVFFYGAGCNTSAACEKLRQVFRDFFPAARIRLAEDMTGAALATAGTVPALVAILGTGSNACYWDGRRAHTDVVSLGYVLMDEGSGNWLGKRLIRDYFYRRMPEALRHDLANFRDMSPAAIKTELYARPAPNVYLASFAPFLSRHRGVPYTEQVLEEAFREFVRNRLTPYLRYGALPLYAVGSVAYYFSDVWRRVTSGYAWTVREVVRRPLPRLVAFHRAHHDE